MILVAESAIEAVTEYFTIMEIKPIRIFLNDRQDLVACFSRKN
jgi:hypothetical protein